MSAFRRSILVKDGYTPQEALTIDQSATILRDPLFRDIKAAKLAGREAEIKVGEVTVVYSPGQAKNYPGVSLFGEHGFSLGPSAFTSPEELAKTVLWEMHRLTFSTMRGVGGSGGEAAETAAADAFAAKAYNTLQKRY
jgi:hypothetical protein